MKGKGIVAALILIISLAVSMRAETVEISIEQAVKLALKNNKSFLISQLGVKQNRYKTRSSFGFLPTVTLEGMKMLDEKLMEIEIPPFFPGGESTRATLDFTKNYEFNFQIIQPVFSGGKLLHIFKNSQLDLKLSKEKMSQVESEVKLEVKKAFFNIMIMEDLLEAHTEAKNLAQQNLAAVDQSYELGLASKYDLLRAELSLESVKPNILRIKKMIAMARLNLKLLIGIPEKNELKLRGALTSNRHPLELGQLVNRALINRTEIKQLQLETAKTANMLKMAYGQFLPDLSLIARYSFRSDFFKFTNDNWEDYYTISLGISFPIFQGLKRVAQVGEMKVLQRIMKLNQEKLSDATRIQINSLYLSADEEYQNIVSSKKSIETAEEGVRVAELNYQEGLISILELHASYNELTRTRVTHLQNVYNYNIALAEIEKLTGIKISGGES